MPRYVRKTCIQFKIESVYGVPEGTWDATDAVLIKDASFQLDPDLVPRNLIRPFLGGSEQLAGSRRAIIDFTVELAAAGAAGTAPQWGQLLRACGMAQVVTAGNRVVYSPVSGSFESGTVRYHIDGVRYASRGARGNAQFMVSASGLPEIKFHMEGFDTNAMVVGTPATQFTGWQKPLIITDANSAEVKLGSSYNGTTGAITGGTALAWREVSIDLGQGISHRKLVGTESVEINARETTGAMTVELTAADEVTWRDAVNAATLTGWSFGIGATAGQIIQVFGPAVQRLNPQMVDYEGTHLVSTDLRFLPSADTGNDEIRIIVR